MTSLVLTFSFLTVVCVYLLSLFILEVMKNVVTTYTELSNSCYDILAVKYVSDGITVFFATDYTLAFTIKITLCLMFLIVIRGCVPRYRYDFLTKMG